MPPTPTPPPPPPLLAQLLTFPSLGKFEYALSLPGSMFGIPLYSLVMLPVVIGAIGEALSGVSGGFAHLIAAAAVLIGVSYWALCLVESVSNPPDREVSLMSLMHASICMVLAKTHTHTHTHARARARIAHTHSHVTSITTIACSHIVQHTGIVRAFYPLGKKMGTVVTLCAPHISVWLMGLSSQEARGAAAYYVAVFYITQLLVEIGKTGIWRLRPVGRFRAQLQVRPHLQLNLPTHTLTHPRHRCQPHLHHHRCQPHLHHHRCCCCQHPHVRLCILSPFSSVLNTHILKRPHFV
jgi:ABC-type nickel/cobalt efflux system permease component RcnA